MTIIQDLDGFVQFIENETTAKRFDEKKKEQVIEAVDLIQNTIEELNYNW